MIPSPLRILYVIDSLTSGGAQRQLVSLVTSLDRSVVHPEVAVYHDLDHYRPDLEEAGVPVHRIGGLGGRDPRVLANLRAHLNAHQYDLVHSYLITPGILVRLASGRRRRHGLVVSMRNVLVDLPAHALFLERALARRADLMIANAEAVRRDVESRFPSWRGRVRVVPNGIDPPAVTDDLEHRAHELRKSTRGGEGILLGLVGRVERQKNPMLLLSAVAKLPGDVRDRLRVVWVGSPIDDGLMVRVRRRLASEPWGDRVAFLPVTRDISAVYLAIDALALCSSWEGFPNVVLEALAHGRPVVSTDVGDASAMVVPGKTGWLVPPEDPAALAGALSELVASEPGERERMGRSGRQLVQERFSVGQLVDRTMGVYDEVLAMRKGGGE
jgi:glycosyltransferase involved in cell wall biosynthesis